MANLLPPPPVNDAPGSFTWLEWYRRLRNYITQNGSVPWNIIDFAGSNITDLVSRSHQNLQSLQGGTSGQYYHLTQADYDKLTRLNNIEYVTPSTGFNSTIGNTTGLYVINPAGTLASGTLVMPATPVDEQQVTIISTQTITALTHNGNTGQTLLNGLTTITSSIRATWIYRSADTTWYRTQ